MVFLLPFKKYLKSPWLYVAILTVFTLIRYLFKKGHTKKSEFGSTISDSTANNYADQLQNAMGGLDQKEHVIFDVIKKLKTRANYNKVYNKFYLRPYIPLTGTYDEFFGNDHNLTSWLFQELNSSERKQITQHSPWVFN